MDVTAAPSWESGLAPVKINPVPASFVAFFPTDESIAGPASTDGSNASGTKPEEIYWAGHLAMPPPVRRLPAWERVPTVAKSQRFSGTIMKRVTAPNFDASSPYSLQASAEARSQTDAARSWRQKLLHRPWDGLKQHRGFVEAPLSEASVTSMRMQARVDVANCLLGKPTASQLPAYGSEYRVVPVKRTLAIDYLPGSERAMPGNKLPLYIELRSLLEKAAEDGVSQIDMTKASFAHSNAILHDLHRNPRKHLTAHGVPDLSSITDATEPTSPHIMSPPRANAEAKSPTKRDTIPSSPLQNSCPRLKAAKVDLLPIASPKVEPSPTKSASAPSTPLKDVFGTPKLAATPSLFSPLFNLYPVAEEGAEQRETALFTPSYRDTSSTFRVSMQRPMSSPVRNAASPCKQPQAAVSTPQSEDNRPGKTFQVPSFRYSSSFQDSSAQETEHHSPSEISRPVAPTPSKWNRTESPSTPVPETPIKNGALGHTASTPTIPAITPAVDFSTFQADSANLSDFDFGPYSLIFASCTAGTTDQAEETKRIKDLHSRRRRQSEPLYKNAFRVQKRRRSASPEKLAQKVSQAITEDDAFVSPAPGSKFAIFTTTNECEKVNEIQHTPCAITPMKIESTPCTNGSDMNGLITATPSIQISPAAEEISTHPSPDTGRATPNHSSVLNIDVRQNPDIFGIHRPDHAVNQLAQMAEARCDGHAKVLVSQENGRLIVRFKLPADYASIFPASQGSDESRFTTTPLAISSSPRIRFDYPQLSHTPSQGRLSNLGISFEPRSRTGSPSKAPALSYNSPTRPARSSPLKARPITQSPAKTPSSARRSGLWGRMSTQADEDATLVVFDFLGTPAAESTQGSPLKSVAETPLSAAESPRSEASGLSILDTPTMSGIGVVDRDTPEHRRFSVLHTPFEGTPLAFTPDARANAASVVTPSTYQGTPSFRQEIETPSVQPTATELPSSPPSASKPSASATEIMNTPQQAFTSEIAEPQNASPAPGSVASVGSPRTPPPADVVESTTPTSSPPLNLSFTPVNLHRQRHNLSTASPEAEPKDSEAHAPVSTPTESEDQVASVPIIAPSPVARHQSVVDDDSPGREYMRDFIKRSKPKRLSTMENGSPVAQPAERMPLGAKSPNTASPRKAKRKLDEKPDYQSPPKKSIEPAPKRTRRTVKAPKHKASMETDELAGPDAAALATTEGVDAQDDDAHMDDGNVTRRSSRLRVLGRTTTANSKSAIPTPIKLNRPGTRRGVAGPVLNSSVRSEQQDLMHQTRLNTRRNKGNAEYPAQVLARCSQELQEDEVQEKMAEQSELAKDRKCVGWKEPLEAHQDKSKKGKTAGKTTQQSNGITKPRKSSALPKSETAETRPQRMTRSRTRSQT